MIFQAEEVVRDCNTAIELEKTNVKAWFRRALAKKVKYTTLLRNASYLYMYSSIFFRVQIFCFMRKNFEFLNFWKIYLEIPENNIF